MISILIPVYNFDITSLICSLQSAIGSSELYSEIIIGSDGSEKAFTDIYENLAKLKRVSLLSSGSNIGRASIRNRLAERSNGTHLLFIDADANILSSAKDYLDRYASMLNSAPVLCGGTLYRNIPPDDPDKYLRWHYGHFKEHKTAKKRNQTPYSSFSGFNFIVEKEIFDRIKFNEDLKDYGHEDTLFGYQLMKENISILHLDNYLLHDGIEPNRIFLQKTREGVRNLNKLYSQEPDKKGFSSMVKLLKAYNLLRMFGLSKLAGRFYARKKRRIEIMLRSRKTSLKLFSLYKLGLFCYYRYNLDRD